MPHDWAVEVGFSEQGSFSHGFKDTGRNFSNNSAGWAGHGVFHHKQISKNVLGINTNNLQKEIIKGN